MKSSESKLSGMRFFKISGAYIGGMNQHCYCLMGWLNHEQRNISKEDCIFLIGIGLEVD